MKNIFTLVLVALLGLCASAQESKKVTMKITYKGNPLCYWDVTLKHGDVAIGQGKTDDKGFVDFGYVRLLSYQVDASGIKKTNNGEKTWDVKGYIVLNDQGHADFDFDPLVQEMGMPGMMESAWGLTLNDCASGGSGTSGSTNTTNSTNTSDTNTSNQNTGTSDQNTSTSDNSTSTTVSTPEPLVVDPAQGYANQKAMYENQIAGLNRKIEKKKEEQAKCKPDSKEYDELTYDIQELELEKELTQVKLEKTEKSIANGNAPLNKTDRDYYNEREDEIKAKQETLKENRKKGVNPNNASNDNSNDDAVESFETYTPEQIAEMRSANIQKLKLEYQTKMTKRKTRLKTRAAFLTPEEKTQLENEIVELEKLIKICEDEIAKRKEEKEGDK